MPAAEAAICDDAAMPVPLLGHRAFRALACMFALSMPHLALAFADEPGSGDGPSQSASTDPARERSIVDDGDPPNSPYTQARRLAGEEQPFGLAGDGFGVRRSLAELGIDFGAELTLDNVWNVRGGTETGYALLSLLDLNLGVRTEPLLDWKGGRLYISMLSYGQSRDPYGLVEDFWGWDAIASGRGSLTQLAELWYEQELFDRMLAVRFGKQDANSTFAAVPGAGAFISSAATYPGTIVTYLPSYPEQSVGLDLVFRPTSWLSARFGWFDGTTNYYDASRGTNWPNTGTRGPKSFFDNPGSWFFISEIDAEWSLGESPLPGSAAVGYWWQTGPVSFVGRMPSAADPSMSIDPTYSTEGSEGFYLGATQSILNFSGDAKATRGVGVFSQIGFGQERSNPASFSLIAGCSATGVIPGRDRDQCGVQLNYVRFTDDDRVWSFPGSDQLGVEVFYRVQLTPSIAIQPDVQWLRQPNGDPDVSDALLLTLRVQLAF